jgi:aspartyl-tRNA(Asn)/glutamyl-tRNA(Gln) amidotransferase subunit A
MSFSDEDLLSSVAELSARLRARTISAVELAEAALARAERLGPKLRCVATLTRERALVEARAADTELAAGRSRGPLHGVPYGLKDLVDTRGIRTTFGAAPFAERVPDRDATVVLRLREAGAVLVAKLAMIELAGGLGYHEAGASLTGACRTPWDPERWAGGSSSGSGAAVAAGIVPFAIGSETWGSITCPAAFCGVTGLRPTYGVVSRAGAMPLSWTMDKLGPLARSAEDCALVLAAIAGEDPADATSVAAPRGLGEIDLGAARGLRVAVLPLPAKPKVSGEVRALWEAALARLAHAGLVLEPAELPPFPYDELASLFVEAEAASAFEPLIRSGRTRALADRSHQKKGPADYEPKASAADLVRAQRLRGEVQRICSRLFDRFDLAVAPNLPWVAPRVDEPLDELFQAADPVGAAGNLAGLPAVAIPMGFAPPGRLPVSLQLVGRPFDEARLLSVAAVFQATSGFHRQRPPVS